MAKKGLTEKQYLNVARNDWYRFVVKPVMILFGLYIVASLLKIFFKIDYELFPALFTGIGGLGYLIYYFKKELKK